jgi:hypothetical protein
MINDSSKYFYASNGVVLKSFTEFRNFLMNCDDSTFVYHVNNEKNDFANWVNLVLKKKTLSKKMFLIKDRREMIDLINPKKKVSKRKV